MRSKGFTLVELLAVIAILAILIIIALPNILKMFNKAKVDTNKIMVLTYSNGAEKYYANEMGSGIFFDGATNIASSIKITGKRADNERVYIDESGDTAIYLIIDGDCYYKLFGSDEVTYERGVGVCEGSNTKIAGYQVDYVNSGNGLYSNNDSTLLTYKSDYTAAAHYIKYTDINCENPSWGEEDYFFGDEYCANEEYWSDIYINHKKLKNGDLKKVHNYIYFNCSSADPRSCEKWRIIKYEGGNEGIGGNLVLVSEDQHGVRYNNSYVLKQYESNLYDQKNSTKRSLAMVLPNHLKKSNNDSLTVAPSYDGDPFKYNDILDIDRWEWEDSDYWDNYYSNLSSSAKGLIIERNYYDGKMCGQTSDDYKLFITGTFNYNINDNESSQYTNEWGNITIRDYVNASNNENCINGAEISKTGNNVATCNNWLNDGSWFYLANYGNDITYDYCDEWSGRMFVGDSGLIKTSMWLGIRSVVTLKNSATIISGNGTYNSPYILEYN